jgi:C4-dicarboxylate transporter, DctQ subunit
MSIIVKSIFNNILSTQAVIAALILAVIMLGICAEVLSRTLGGSIYWMMEVVEYSMLYLTLLGAAWVLKSEGHVTMDIVLMKIRLRYRYFIYVITSFICAIACLVIVWYGVETTLITAERGSVLGTILEPPLFILIAVIPFGFFLLFIQFLLRTYVYLQKWRASYSQQRIQQSDCNLGREEK